MDRSRSSLAMCLIRTAAQLLPGFALAIGGAGCTRHFEAASSVRFQGVPTCAKGHKLPKELIVRVEKGSDYTESGVHPELPSDAFDGSISKDWVGQKVTVKVGTCDDAHCETRTWLDTSEVVLGGTGDAAVVPLPKLNLTCDDGNLAKQ